MDGFFVLLGLAALLAFFLGPIGFFLNLGARERLRDALGQIARLEARLKRLESGAPSAAAPFAQSQQQTDAVPQVQPDVSTTPREPAVDLPGSAPIAARVSQPAAEVSGQSPPQTPPPAPPPAPPRRSFEEALGARWTVWVGGVALALGALLLVRYSIEQGYFGPGARILMALAFAGALIGAGEWLRRKEPGARQPDSEAQQAQQRNQNAYIPGVLTAAGAVAAFGAIYAAYALYEFIGAATAFIALGATGVACMFAAALHGPALAGLGLVGSLATPILVSTNQPNPWALTIYLAVVSLASYALARLRRWLWLALATAAGSGLWAFAFVESVDSENAAAFFAAGAAHVVLATALAAWFISIDPWRGADSASVSEDPFAVLIPAGFAFIAQVLLFVGAHYGQFGLGWIAFAATIATLLAATGFMSAPAAAVTAISGLFIAATLRVWPGTFATDMAWRLPDWSLVSWVEPVDASRYVAFAIIAALGLAALCVNRLLSARMTLINACLFAGTGALTPLLALIVAYLRFGRFDTSYVFAAIAAALGVAFVFVAQIFRARLGSIANEDRPPSLALGLGSFASATIAALALAFVFALQGGTLTVALALAALGAAYVSAQLEIPALRWCVAALGVAVAARLAWDPRIVGAALGRTLIFNWLLVGYGVPALAFGFAARVMRRADGAEDTPIRIAQALSILLGGFLIFFEIRHALHDGDIYARSASFVEQGLLAFCGFGFGAALLRLDRAQRSPVFRIASLAAGVGSMILAVLGLGLFTNPLFSGQRVAGGALFDTLLLGYALPAVAAFALARLSIGLRPAPYITAARVVTIALVFAWLTLETRHLFQGETLTAFKGVSQTEWYAYSAVWLAFGLLLLAYGLWRGSREARLASALFVFLTVVKVFVFDLAGLTGLLRPLSFIGLGLVLLGIGFVYQKLVFARPRQPPEDSAAPVV